MRVGLCMPEVHPLVTLPLASPDTITTLRVKSAAFAHQRPDKCWVFTIKCSVDRHEALNSEQKALQIFVLFVFVFFRRATMDVAEICGIVSLLIRTESAVHRHLLSCDMKRQTTLLCYTFLLFSLEYRFQQLKRG